MRFRAVCILGLVLISHPILAAAGQLMAYTDLDLTKRTHKCFNGGAQVDVHFVYDSSPTDPHPDQIRAIRFRVPTPACMTVAARVDIAAPGTNFIGSSSTEVSVGLPSCTSIPVHVLTVRLFIVGVLQECCPFQPQDVVVTDCGLNEFPGVSALPGYFGNQPCDFTAPHSPTPADGASISSLSTNLEWQSEWNIPDCDLGDVRLENLYFGMNPGALAKTADVGTPWPIDNLSSGATYYWKVELTTINGAGPWESPLWSFTVENPLDATTSTWGRIKAFYR
jgi:hypothetical protein